MPEETSKRQPKLNALIKSALSEYITNEMELEGLVSLSSVDVAPNMESAIIWVSVYGGDEDRVLAEFKEQSNDIRSYLGRKLFIRTAPRLKFQIDPSAEYAAEISQKLKEVQEEDE